MNLPPTLAHFEVHTNYGTGQVLLSCDKHRLGEQALRDDEGDLLDVDGLTLAEILSHVVLHVATHHPITDLEVP